MKRNILVRGARQLLTLHGTSAVRRGEALQDLGLIEDGSVLITGGTIASIGPTRRIENLAEARQAEEINASGRVVMPGFVDSHTHLLSAPAKLNQFRTLSSEHGMAGPLGDPSGVPAVLQYVRNTPAASLEFTARKYLESCVRHGTTTIEVNTGHALNASGETKMLRVLSALDGSCASVVPAFFGAHVVPPEYFERSTAYMEWLCTELVPRLREKGNAQFAGVLCDPQGFNLRETKMYIDCARRVSLPVKVHAERTARIGGAELAVRSEAVSIDGLNYATTEDAELIARSRSVATLLPGRVYYGVDTQLPPARALIESGAAVALATAFQPSVPSTFSMQMIISLACKQMGMTPEEAISAATINGAHALGRARTCGSLQFGKHADLIILNASDYREIPFYFGVNLVSLVMRAGEVIYTEGNISCGA